jgi:hypothetical protein
MFSTWINSRYTHGHIWSWTVTSFQTSRGTCEWVDTQQKCVGVVSLRFVWELNTQGILSVPIGKHLKDWGRANVGAACFENCLRTFNIDRNFFLAFVLGTHSWSFSKHLKYILPKATDRKLLLLLCVLILWFQCFILISPAVKFRNPAFYPRFLYLRCFCMQH